MPNNFTNRVPKQIDLKEFQEGSSLLGKGAREIVAKKVKEKDYTGWINLEGMDSINQYPYPEVYIARNGKAFVKATEIGSGASGKVYLTQNLKTGKWYFMKIAKKKSDNFINPCCEVYLTSEAPSDFRNLPTPIIVCDTTKNPIEIQQIIARKITENDQTIVPEQNLTPDSELKRILEEYIQYAAKISSDLITKQLLPMNIESSVKNDKLITLFEKSGYLPDGIVEGIELRILKQQGMLQAYDEQTIIGELIHGQNLDEILDAIIAKSSPLSFERALTLSISILEAYERLQRNGYVHRDIKPGNIMVEQDRCIAIDFELTLKRGTPCSMDGTLPFMSLETVIGGIAEPKNDIYAIGAVISEIFSAGRLKCNYTEHHMRNQDLESRYQYVEEIESAFEKSICGSIDVARKEHQKISHVILGAKDLSYQKDEKFFQEQIAVYQLLFDMTDRFEQRPSLTYALQRIRKIRLEYIRNKLVFNLIQNCELISQSAPVPEGELKTALKKLLKIRDEMENSPYLQDDIEIFLLKCIDNQQTLEQVRAYTSSLEDTRKQKLDLNKLVKQEGNKVVRHEDKEEKEKVERKRYKEEEDYKCKAESGGAPQHFSLSLGLSSNPSSSSSSSDTNVSTFISYFMTTENSSSSLISSTSLSTTSPPSRVYLPSSGSIACGSTAQNSRSSLSPELEDSNFNNLGKKTKKKGKIRQG